MHQLDCEAKLKTTVRIGHPCVPWLVETVADIISRFKIGQDGLANGKAVRTRSATLTLEKLAHETFPRIQEPTPAECTCPRSHAATRADSLKVGEWTPGSGKCKAMKEATNLAHSAECRGRVAEILANDVEFRTKLKKDEDRQAGARDAMEEEVPRVQVGGSSSCRSAPVEPTTQSSAPERRCRQAQTLRFRCRDRCTLQQIRPLRPCQCREGQRS